MIRYKDTERAEEEGIGEPRVWITIGDIFLLSHGCSAPGNLVWNGNHCSPSWNSPGYLLRRGQRFPNRSASARVAVCSENACWFPREDCRIRTTTPATKTSGQFSFSQRNNAELVAFPQHPEPVTEPRISPRLVAPRYYAAVAGYHGSARGLFILSVSSGATSHLRPLAQRN